MKIAGIFFMFLMLGCTLMSACLPVQTQDAMEVFDAINQPTLVNTDNQTEFVQSITSTKDLVETQTTREPESFEQGDAKEEATETQESLETELIVQERIFDGLTLAGVSVEFWHIYYGEHGDGMQSLVDEFNISNPYGIQVEALAQGSYPDIEYMVDSGKQSKNLPNVVLAYTNKLLDWYHEDVIADITPYIQDMKYGLTSAEMDDLFPHLKRAVKTRDGAWIAYPMTQSANVLVYNFTWAEDLGFWEPPQTSDELKTLVCTAAEAAQNVEVGFEGKGGMVYVANASNWLQWLYAFNGHELNESGTAYNFYTQEAIDASMFLLDLKDNACLYLYDGYPNPLQAQRTAMISMSSTAGIPYYTAAFRRADNSDLWGFIAAPGPDGKKAVDSFQQMLGVLKGSPEEELASWLFIKWLTSPEIQARWLKINRGYYGTHYSSDSYLLDYAAENAVWASGAELIKYGFSEPETFPAWSSVRDLIDDMAVELIYATNQADVEAILAAYTEMANALVEKGQ
ncbi:MAG: extracellular solute-binding protein [Anaerolineales bacterium]